MDTDNTVNEDSVFEFDTNMDRLCPICNLPIKTCWITEREETL